MEPNSECLPMVMSINSDIGRKARGPKKPQARRIMIVKLAGGVSGSFRAQQLGHTVVEPTSVWQKGHIVIEPS